MALIKLDIPIYVREIVVIAPQQERSNKNDPRFGNNAGVNLIKSESMWDYDFNNPGGDGKWSKWLGDE